VPKVIDFGVAKALHQKLTERTMFTAFGTVEEAVRAMKDGAAIFLTKPVQEDQFIAAVSKLIGGTAISPAAKAAVAVMQ